MNLENKEYNIYNKWCHKIKCRFLWLCIERILFILVRSYILTSQLLIISIVLIIFDLRYFIKKYLDIKNNIFDISDKSKRDLDNELKNIVFASKSEEYFLTENCIIDYEGLSIIKYTDIILATEKLGISGSMYNAISGRVIVFTKDKRIKFNVWDTNLESDKRLKEDLLKIIKDKNPDVLIGNTKKNRELIYEKYKLKYSKLYRKFI